MIICKQIKDKLNYTTPRVIGIGKASKHKALAARIVEPHAPPQTARWPALSCGFIISQNIRLITF